MESPNSDFIKNLISNMNFREIKIIKSLKKSENIIYIIIIIMDTQILVSTRRNQSEWHAIVVSGFRQTQRYSLLQMRKINARTTVSIL